jgi:hypothetical protein
MIFNLNLVNFYLNYFTAISKNAINQNSNPTIKRLQKIFTEAQNKKLFSSERRQSGKCNSWLMRSEKVANVCASIGEFLDLDYPKSGFLISIRQTFKHSSELRRRSAESFFTRPINISIRRFSAELFAKIFKLFDKLFGRVFLPVPR